MKLTTSLAVALGVIALAACHKSATEQQAENVQANYENEASNVENASQNEAQAIENAGNNEASAIKNEGKNEAAEIRNSGNTSNSAENTTEKKKTT